MRLITTAIAAWATVVIPQSGIATASPAAWQFQQNDTVRPNGGDRAVQQILTRIRADADALRRSLDDGRRRDTRSRRSQDADPQYALDDVMSAADQLGDRLNSRDVQRGDVEELMRRGGALETLVLNWSPSSATQSAWNNLRRDLDGIASAYGVRSNWRNPGNAPIQSASYDRLQGTYQLDSARSDDPRRVLNQATRDQNVRGRGRVQRDLEARLTPPETIAIDRSGNRVTLASSNGPRMTFDADGRAVSERGFGSRNITTRATAYGDRLEVVTNGDGDNDYSVTFEPVDGGRSLRMTKRLHDSALTDDVVVQSVYRRTSDTPDWTISRSRRNGAVGTSGSFNDAVPEGTILTGTLDEPLNLRDVRTNDRVSLTVHDASDRRFENAVIEGYVTSAPSDSTNSAELAIAFDRIRLSNGRTADFSSTVENVRGPNGESISFNGERADGDNSQRDDAIQRGAIGAAVGAVIGAIAGGSKGAAIGAVIGGGGGAASVMIGGQRQTELPRGTQFTIRSTGSR